MPKWTAENIPDQTGRVAIVTGANTGIGFETAKALAAKGADVILACRNTDKGQAALTKIQTEFPKARVTVEQLDLSDLDNVEAFAERSDHAHDRLDLLILNAGVMVPPESKTSQGFELQFGVNHLGHFALTGRLLPRLSATENSRVVVVSSTAALRGEMNFDDLNFEKRGYAAWAAYSQSKLANQLFTLELQRRLDAAGLHVMATAAHPGWTQTDLQRTSGFFRFLNPVLAMKPPQGCLPTLRAAVDPEARGGDYFGPDGFMQMRGYPKRIEMAKAAQNKADAAKLWEMSERMTGVSYETKQEPLVLR